MDENTKLLLQIIEDLRKDVEELKRELHKIIKRASLKTVVLFYCQKSSM